MYEQSNVPCQKMYFKYLCHFKPSSDCTDGLRFRMKTCTPGGAHYGNKSHWEGVGVLIKPTILTSTGRPCGGNEPLITIKPCSYSVPLIKFQRSASPPQVPFLVRFTALRLRTHLRICHCLHPRFLHSPGVVRSLCKPPDAPPFFLVAILMLLSFSSRWSDSIPFKAYKNLLYQKTPFPSHLSITSLISSIPATKISPKREEFPPLLQDDPSSAFDEIQKYVSFSRLSPKSQYPLTSLKILGRGLSPLLAL